MNKNKIIKFAVLSLFISCQTQNKKSNDPQNDFDTSKQQSINVVEKSINDSIHNISTFKIDTVFDDISGEKYLKTNEIEFKNTSTESSFKISFTKTLSVTDKFKTQMYKSIGYPFIMTINIVGNDKCSNKGVAMDVLFQNEKRNSLYNGQAFNCDGFQFYDLINNALNVDALYNFRAFPVKKIRLTTSKKLIDVELSERQSTVLFDIFKILGKKM